MTTKKTAAKTTKPAAKTKTTKPAATTEPKKPVVKAAKPKTPPTHDEIAHLARQYWIEGGHREGHAEHDWQRAKHELSRK